MEILDLRDHKVQEVFLDLQDHLVMMDLMDHRGIREALDLQEELVSLDYLAKKVHLEKKEKRVMQDYQVSQEQLALEEKEEVLVLLVFLVKKDKKENQLL